MPVEDTNVTVNLDDIILEIRHLVTDRRGRRVGIDVRLADHHLKEENSGRASTDVVLGLPDCRLGVTFLGHHRQETLVQHMGVLGATRSSVDIRFFPEADFLESTFTEVGDDVLEVAFQDVLEIYGDVENSSDIIVDPSELLRVLFEHLQEVVELVSFNVEERLLVQRGRGALIVLDAFASTVIKELQVCLPWVQGKRGRILRDFFGFLGFGFRGLLVVRQLLRFGLSVGIGFLVVVHDENKWNERGLE